MEALKEIASSFASDKPIATPKIPVGFTKKDIGTPMPHSDHQHRALQTNINGYMYGLCVPDRPTEIRPITVQGLSADGAMVSAYCHLQNMACWFRLEGLALTDLTTQEMFDDPSSYLRAHYLYAPDSQDENPAERRLFKACMFHCQHELNILAFMGWVDGRFHEAEKLVALKYLKTAYQRPFACLRDAMAPFQPPRFVSETLMQHMVKAIHNVSPDVTRFKAAMAHVAEDKARSDLLGAFLGHMMLADGVVAPEEMELLQVLKPIAS
jgi:hypothetical protein